MREILTLQLGNAANHALTHLWNLQCAYPADGGAVDHDVMFTNVANRQNDPVPRSIVVDFRDACGSVASATAPAAATPRGIGGGGNEDDEAEAFVGWAADRIDPTGMAGTSSSTGSGTSSEYHQRLAAAENNDDENNTGRLDPSRIKSWPDYLHPYLHPQSLFPVTRPLRFDSAAAGAATVASADWIDELLETRVRKFLEDADSVQGIVLATDATAAGWMGVAATLAPRIADDLGTKMPVLVPMMTAAAGGGPPQPPLALATAAAVAALVDAFSTVAVVPLAMTGGTAAVVAGESDDRKPGVQSARYLATAAAAMALDVLLAPVRDVRTASSTGGGGTGHRLADLIDAVTAQGRGGSSSAAAPLVRGTLWCDPVVKAVGGYASAFRPGTALPLWSLTPPATSRRLTAVVPPPSPRPDAELWVRVGQQDQQQLLIDPTTGIAVVPWPRAAEYARPAMGVVRSVPFPFTTGVESERPSQGTPAVAQWTMDARGVVAPVVRGWVATARAARESDLAERLEEMVGDDGDDELM
ncbi:hypothetical protein BC828DRAFT_388200 [Blastocladiella britannica]|nr:hypothetical protein BC828DRAFT_388200 [Blastocladiella britannica]